MTDPSETMLGGWTLDQQSSLDLESVLVRVLGCLLRSGLGSP